MQSDLDKNNQLLADFSAENSDLKKDLKVHVIPFIHCLCKMYGSCVELFSFNYIIGLTVKY